MNHWMRIIRGLGILTVILFAVAALSPATNYVGRHLAVKSEVKPSGAIVVLGAGLMHGGILNDESMRRAIRGIELYKQGFAPLIVFSGPSYGEGSGVTEAQVRSKLAVALGIPSE